MSTIFSHRVEGFAKTPRKTCKLPGERENLVLDEKEAGVKNIYFEGEGVSTRDFAGVGKDCMDFESGEWNFDGRDGDTVGGLFIEAFLVSQREL